MKNTREETTQTEMKIDVVSAEERKEKTFQHYKNRLVHEVRNASGNENIRFNAIEFLCSFPSIDPFVMAASIIKDGINVLFDDSSISKQENKAKERKVQKLLK